MKNLWKQIKPKYQVKIRDCSHKYESAKRLKYKLMAAGGWYDLDLESIRSLLVYTDVFSHQLTGTDIMYGHQFLKQEDNE